MARCEFCGHYYDKSFRISLGNEYDYGSFERNLRVTPLCQHYQGKIIGPAVEKSGKLFCCQHCAQQVN